MGETGRNAVKNNQLVNMHYLQVRVKRKLLNNGECRRFIFSFNDYPASLPAGPNGVGFNSMLRNQVVYKRPVLWNERQKILREGVGQAQRNGK